MFLLPSVLLSHRLSHCVACIGLPIISPALLHSSLQSFLHIVPFLFSFSCGTRYPLNSFTFTQLNIRLVDLDLKTVTYTRFRSLNVSPYDTGCFSLVLCISNVYNPHFLTSLFLSV